LAFKCAADRLPTSSFSLPLPQIEPDVTGRIGLDEPGKLGLRAELTLGRLAMLLFAGAAVVEALNGGRSPLAAIGAIDPGGPLSAAPALFKAGIVLFAMNGIGVFSGFNTRKDSDVY
jgi:hypothetical protein